eukprot:jgi/Astpho2/2802/e_gw1.00050.156.1_t
MSSHCIAGSQHFAAFPVQSYSRGCNLGHTCNATRHLLKHLRCRAEVRDVSTRTANSDALFNALTEACQEYKRVPPSMKTEFSGEIVTAMEGLKAAGALKKWGKGLEGLERRNVFMGELRNVGIKAPEAIAKPSVRNDAAFLGTTVLTTSVIAVAAGSLPGDWGFFVPYLTGAICLVVLAVGSTAPGLLQVVIGKFSSVFPDYRERVLRHEAAHFLTGYLLGLPIVGYSLDLQKAHTDFAEAKIGKRIIERQLEDEEINQLAVVAMAGATSEGMKYPEVQGQTADMIDLQRFMLRSKQKMTDNAQQNMTRWAVYNAAKLLRDNEKEYNALQSCMQRNQSVSDCIMAIEQA